MAYMYYYVVGRTDIDIAMTSTGVATTTNGSKQSKGKTNNMEANCLVGLPRRGHSLLLKGTQHMFTAMAGGQA